MKASFYFKHDYNARGDERTTALRMKMGPEGYGIYWLIIEKLYESNGRLDRDFEALSWALHADTGKIKAVVENFGLFKNDHGKIACARVDSGLSELEECRARAREAGRQGGLKRALNARLADAKQGEDKRGEEGKDKTTATPSAVDQLIDGIKTDVPRDYFAWRFPKGFNAKYAGTYLINVPAEDCSILLNTPRLGKEIRSALEWRIEQKRLERYR